MGNTFVHKSSERSPLSAIFLGRLFKEAGFPPGVVNLLSGDGKTGSLMASHMDIARISFTGSTAAGRKVQIAAAQSNLKPVTLELGGKSASIVFDDADLENAVKHNSQNFLFNNAQACSAATRLLVHESIANDFVENLKNAWAGLSKTIGDPADENTFMGPMVDQAQADRVKEYVEGAKADGIDVLFDGGDAAARTGSFSGPVILMNPGLDSRVWKEEIFGPVLVVRTFKTEEEALGLANDTEFGLSSMFKLGRLHMRFEANQRDQASSSQPTFPELSGSPRSSRSARFPSTALISQRSTPRGQAGSRVVTGKRVAWRQSRSLSSPRRFTSTSASEKCIDYYL